LAIPSKYYSSEEENIRRAVNQWILGTHQIDDYFDFEMGVVDKERPTWMTPELEWRVSGSDTNNAGERRFAAAVDVLLFG